MPKISLKSLLLFLGLLMMPVFGYLLWNVLDTPETLSTLTASYDQTGTEVRQDLETLAPQAITEEDQTYTITDTTSDGIDIQFANETESDDSLRGLASKSPLTLSFPKDYSQPIEVKLDDKRTITITDLGGKSDYQASTISASSPDSLGGSTSKLEEEPKPGLFERILSLRGSTSKSLLTPKSQKPKASPQYLRYTSEDERKELLYAYQKDQGTGEKKLKHWTLYQEGNGVEQESYRIENAKLKVTEEGIAQVFYYGQEEQQQSLKNDQAATEVDSNLLERAQRTLAKEMGEDLLNGNHTPDLTIPKPYYIDKEGNKHDAEWKWHEEERTLSVSFTPESYPVALDPTLSFTAPGTTNSGSVITGEAVNSSFGYAMASGDWNADGKMDLAVGATGYSSSTGRVYVFYNDGALPTAVVTADVIITGEANSSRLGASFTSGDFNADGKTDLAVGASNYTTITGRAYIFYGGSIITENASGADIILTGSETVTRFGVALTSGDYNADGRTDLAVGADYYYPGGRAYIFYGGSIITENATGADITIDGEGADSFFGASLISGDYNADGKTDLAVGAYGYSSNTGRAYIFYNDGSIPTTAATADVIITGEAAQSYLGNSLAAGDWNADGKIDLAVGAYGYSTITGRAYIFYNGSIITEAATGADVILTGETTNNYFGWSLTPGDFNSDGKTDLAVGAYGYSTNTGRAYLFYNDGSIPTTAATADVVITGEGTSNYFGYSLAPGDYNADGKTDLAVGAYAYAGFRGRAYIFYSQNGQVNTNQSIVGDGTGSYFGSAMAAGDLNADGRADLVVSAFGYPSTTWTGRVYIFYNDGAYPTAATSADVTITGEAAGMLGNTFSIADFNADGKADLAVGSREWSSNTGRTYIFYADGTNNFGTAACSGTPASCLAANADVIITGETTSNYFGRSLAAGDFNADGETDLAVGAQNHNSGVGRVYIFYNDGAYPAAAASAEVLISGQAGNLFGFTLTAGDFDANGTTDLAVGGYGYDVGSNTNEGRAYVFYADGTNNFGTATCSGTPAACSAANADAIMTGAAGDQLGYTLAAGDLNADGKVDLVVGAWAYSSNTGRVHVFYNGSIASESSSGADVTITGESGTFGNSLATGDFNADGRTDLVVGAVAYSTNTGRVYIFHNDGSLPTTAVTADVMITGDTTNVYLGYYNFAVGDLDGDGRTNLVVGTYAHSTNTGKIYIYETRENFAWEIQGQFGGTGRTGVNGTGQELQITGETGSGFGAAMATGDFNADGKTDLAVGARNYSSNTGRAYIFYGDGSLTVGATSADVIITGEGGSLFGISLAAGDWNADGKTDLVVGAYGYSSSAGRAYIFYNDGSIPTTGAMADIILTGEAGSAFGTSLTAGDFNADGKTDLAVGALFYSTSTGRAYIFYNDGSIPTTGATADIILTGEAMYSYFGISLAAGDFNADGKTDLAVGAQTLLSFGYTYIFYNGSIITEVASGADVKISGEASSSFGSSLAAGDFNADGKTDLAVGAYGYNPGAAANTGRAYIFYSGAIITEAASGADVIITGEATSNYFGSTMTSGDWNADGKTDLAVGAYGYSTNTGRAYIFHNDGSIPTTAATADIILTGETTSNYFGGYALASGDFNADGETDLAVGAYGQGKVYIYTFNDPIITGAASSDYFGWSMASGDLNADGKTDLVVGAWRAVSGTGDGRAYIFYNDGSTSATAASADVMISGETTDDQFSYSLATGDLNADGKVDLIVGANTYPSSGSVGRAYIFYNGSIITENASGADVIISGASSTQFGTSLVTGDLNADGKTDLVVGGNMSAGVAYLFYNDGSLPTTAATADITLTGETGSAFGTSLTTGDFNADGETDLAVGGRTYSTNTGRAYIFYNGSIITETATDADVIITGETTSNYLGSSLTSGDFNADGKTDLAVGAYLYSSSTGRAYIFYNDGSIPTTAATADVTLTGEASSSFGIAFASGDYNADGKTDLAIGAYGYSTNTGRTYLFFNGSIITEAATGADVILTGEASNYFGYSLASGDYNADGKIDLAVGAYRYSSSTGRVFLFTSEVSAASTPPGTATLKGGGTLKGTATLK